MHRSLHLGKPCGGREGYGPVRGWGKGAGLNSSQEGGVNLHYSLVHFWAFHTVQLSKTDGYLFAMENIYHLIFIWGKSNQGKRSWTNNQAFHFKVSAWERAPGNFQIDTIVGEPQLKIGTMLRKAMLFHLIYLVCVTIFLKMLPSKPKCMLIDTASGKPLLKIGTILLTVAMLFHFI